MHFQRATKRQAGGILQVNYLLELSKLHPLSNTLVCINRLNTTSRLKFRSIIDWYCLRLEHYFRIWFYMQCMQVDFNIIVSATSIIRSTCTLSYIIIPKRLTQGTLQSSKSCHLLPRWLKRIDNISAHVQWKYDLQKLMDKRIYIQCIIS